MQDAIVVHRYFPADGCAVAEGCVGAPGWRRVIAFTATVTNAGGAALALGKPGEGPYFDHHLFTWSPCHMHHHFREYGLFSFGSTEGEKRAFCLLSSSRRMNHAGVALATIYESCAFQGIAPGWADDYAAGIGCQWIDVTDVDPGPSGVTGALGFTVNPEGYLCEGIPVTDAEGAPVFEPTGEVDENGDPISRPACERAPGWSANNTGLVSVTLDPKGNAVTSPCPFALYDGRRDCLFAEASAPFTCAPGEPVLLTCSVADPSAPQALRACETSEVLGSAIPCRARDALGAAIVDGDNIEVTVSCPEPRGPDEPGGAFVLFATPVIPQDPAVPVVCVP